MKQTLEVQRTDYVLASDALRILGVRRQTLYAYVSRGWIRSVAQPGRRDRLYLRHDVEKTRGRSLARSGHGPVAASAMNWGEPIIPTSITEITPQGHLYRGKSALQLARSGATFENVAELLWSGVWRGKRSHWPLAQLPSAMTPAAGSTSGFRTYDRQLEMLALVALRIRSTRGSITDRVSGSRTLDAARQIIQTLVGCFGYLSPRQSFVSLRKGEGIANGLVRGLDLKETAENREALQTMLILFADHELSTAAFVARVTASSGATLHSCLAAAICASSGLRIAQFYDHLDKFLARADTPSALLTRARQWQARGVAVPGFGHPLYPRGDPRGAYLLELVKRRARQSKRLEAIYGFVDAAAKTLDLHPRYEFGIVTLAIALGLPSHCAGTLVSLARTAGWVAHVREQRLSGVMLRPRAKFVNP